MFSLPIFFLVMFFLFCIKFFLYYDDFNVASMESHATNSTVAGVCSGHGNSNIMEFPLCASCSMQFQFLICDASKTHGSLLVHWNHGCL